MHELFCLSVIPLQWQRPRDQVLTWDQVSFILDFLDTRGVELKRRMSCWSLHYMREAFSLFPVSQLVRALKKADWGSWIKGFPCKPGGLSLDPQNSRETCAQWLKHLWFYQCPPRKQGQIGEHEGQKSWHTYIHIGEQERPCLKVEDEGQHLRLYCDVYSHTVSWARLHIHTWTHKHYILMHNIYYTQYTLHTCIIHRNAHILHI